jgi:hypothetical protein
MILDMIQGCWYLRRSTDRWLLSKNLTTRLEGLESWHGAVCCEVVRSLLQTLRVHIYTLSLTWLLVDHDCNIYCLKLTTWHFVGFVSIINPLPSLYPVHVITHSWTFLLSAMEQIFCRMMMHSRPQTLLPNALKEISCRMVLSCQIRPICQSPLVPIFGVNICPFNYEMKGDFIPELTINARHP